MNTPTPGRTLTQHRKVAVNFRDSLLLRVFQLSLSALQDMAAKGADAKLKELGLQLCSLCISFDFVGTCLDDSSDELLTIQASWRGGALRGSMRARGCPGCALHDRFTAGTWLARGPERRRARRRQGAQGSAAWHTRTVTPPGRGRACCVAVWRRYPARGARRWRTRRRCSCCSSTTPPPRRRSATRRSSAW